MKLPQSPDSNRPTTYFCLIESLVSFVRQKRMAIAIDAAISLGQLIGWLTYRRRSATNRGCLTRFAIRRKEPA